MRTLLTLALLTACSEPTPAVTDDPTPEPTPLPTPTPEPVDADGDGAAEDVDCNDADPDVFPGAPERCNDRDDDCDGGIDEDLVFESWYVDGDADGFGAGDALSSCAPVAGASLVGGDCDDAAGAVYPGAVETCDGVDEDCDGAADDGLVFQDWYADDDGDGHGAVDAVAVSSCLDQPGHALTLDDCDDADAMVHPMAEESCNEVDDDCDGEVDEGVQSLFSVDLDLDGYGAEVWACADPDGPGDELPGDCEDGEPSVHPGAVEVCDGFDTDCAGGQEERAVPGQYATVQEAVDAASAGAVICLAAGVHTGAVVVDRDLEFAGAGRDTTVLDGAGTDRVLDVVAGSVTVRDLTVRNGHASDGAGIRFQDALGVSLLENVLVADNRCSVGPCSGVGVSFTGDLTLDGVALTGNEATIVNDANVVGVGLYGTDGVLTAHDLDISENTGTCVGSIWIDGGGMFLQEVTATLTDGRIADNHLDGGQTRSHGFGAYGGELTMEGFDIVGNSAYGDSYPYPAKGVIQLGGDAVIRNSLIRDNAATVEDGRTLLGTVFTTFGLSTITIENTTITGNTGPGSWSSLLDANGDTVAFRNVIVHDNEGSSLIRNNGTTTMDYSLVNTSGLTNTVVSGGTGNVVDLDPSFVDEAGGDLRLSAASPALDAGDPTWFDPDGSRSDMGAHGGPGALP